MGFFIIIAGFAAGVYLSWRQPTSASRGLLIVNGAIGVFYWLMLLTSERGVENPVWLWAGCFLWGFAMGNVARYAECDGTNSHDTRSMAEMEKEEDRPKTHPVLPFQAIVIVPVYWLGSLAWWWLYHYRDQQSPDADDVVPVGSISGASVLQDSASSVDPVWFGQSDQSLALWSLAAICGLLVAWRFRRLAAPEMWNDFFAEYGIKAYHPATVFGLLFCGYILAGVPAAYFIRVKMDEQQIVWPERKAYVGWESHQFVWGEISDILIYKTKTGRSKYGDTYSPRLRFRLKDGQETTISLFRDMWLEALDELKVRAKRRGIKFTRE